MNAPEAIDKDKIIAELKAENADLKEQHSLWYGTEEIQKRVKAIISENKVLKAEVTRIRDELAGLIDNLNELQNIRTSGQERILMQVKINSLLKENDKLQAEVNNLVIQLEEKEALTEEEQKLIEFARDLKAKQTGRRESKAIRNEFIKEKYLSGCKPSEIHKAIVEEEKVWCTLKTVIDRINKMKDRGELPKDDLGTDSEVSNPMSEKKDKLLFNISVIEQYRDTHKLDGDKVISLFKSNSVFDYLNEHYDTLHTMSIDSVVNDIEEIINRGQL